MRWIDEQFVYVALRLDSHKLDNLDHMVVDAGSGAIRWRKPRNEPHDRYTLVYGTDDVLLFSITDKRGRERLLAIDSADGVARWQVKRKSRRNEAPVAPTIVAQAGLVVIVDTRERTSVALDIASGARRWSRPFEADSSKTHDWLSDGSRLWQIAGRLTEVAPANGQAVAVAPELEAGGGRAGVQLDDGFAFVVDVAGHVQKVETESLSRVWRYVPPAGLTVSNVYPYDERVYIRAHGSGAGNSQRYRLVCLDAGNGVELWSQDTPEASLSNLIRTDGAVFHATGSTLYRLDDHSGSIEFAAHVTDTGRSFPVRLRETDDDVVYIGELVVAGFDKSTGASTYRRGMTPIAADASLNAVEVSIPRLRAQMGSPQGQSFQLGMASQYQSMANRYHSQARSYRTQSFMARSAGMDSRANSADFQAYEAMGAANRASNQARTMAAVEMSMSIINLANQLGEMWRLAGIQATIDRHELFRASILSNYTTAENYRYVYRPHARYRSADDHFVGVEVVNLDTGASRFNYLSPSYRAYGLVNLVDFERGTIIHHGVGLDASDHRYSDLRKNSAVAPKMRTVEGFIMAVPARLP